MWWWEGFRLIKGSWGCGSASCLCWRRQQTDRGDVKVCDGDTDVRQRRGRGGGGLAAGQGRLSQDGRSAGRTLSPGRPSEVGGSGQSLGTHVMAIEDEWLKIVFGV